MEMCSSWVLLVGSWQQGNAHPAFKPIWFLPAQKANTEKNQKILNLASSDLKQKYK